jgi:AhpD family alkylhydroperoxidase
MEPRINLMANEVGAKINRRIYAVAMEIQGSSLPHGIQELVELRASQINGCGWCTDVHTKEAAAAGETALRLNLVAAWRHTTVFTEAERAALALAEEGTRLADAAPGVSDETWAQVRKHYDENQATALVALVAMINATNRLAVITNTAGGSYEPTAFASLQS